MTSNGNAGCRCSAMRNDGSSGRCWPSAGRATGPGLECKETMSISYSYLLACWGDGPGNLAPALTAARRLSRRGHEVRVLADSSLRAEVEAAGFPFASWRRPPKFSDVGVDAVGPARSFSTGCYSRPRALMPMTCGRSSRGRGRTPCSPTACCSAPQWLRSPRAYPAPCSRRTSACGRCRACRRSPAA